MKGLRNRLLSLILSVVMVLSGVNFTLTEKVGAAQNAAAMTTESIDDPVEKTVNAKVYFVHSATKKIITLDGKVENLIDCNMVYDVNKIPENGLFTIYYGVWENKHVVNFTNTATNTSWKADNDRVFQMEKRTNPSGWESVQMEAQGDGTVSFKSSANDAYFTVVDDKLALTKIAEGESVSPNEKFIMYTDATPKTAKKVRLSNISGESVKVSWDGVNECLYSGYEVMYSTSENGEYVSAGSTGDTSYVVSGLKLNTTYYFKVRTITNAVGGVYADSKIAYATTLKEYKPSKPENVNVENKSGKIEVTWDKAGNAKKYKVYRAVSRFAEYKEIGETLENKFVDETPNNSKYKNYYKIQAINDSEKSELSEPGSIEISMFGLNSYIFSDSDNMSEINGITQKIFKKQHYNQFGNDRYLLAFKQGDYKDAGIVDIAYYTQLVGLGKTPYDVRLNNVHTPAALSGNNTTCNFWVGIENVTIADVENNNNDCWFLFQWGVSQAAPARRLNVERKTHLQWQWEGWCSGGFIADTYFAKPAGSYSQQQYYYRNCNFNQGAYGVNWNQVIQGSQGITKSNTSDNSGKKLSDGVNLLKNNGITNWNKRGCTTIVEKTPTVREKPFLYFDKDEEQYKVFIPAQRKDTTGVSWSKDNMGQGTSISVDKYFYIANPDRDTAKTINKQLRMGKNIIFSPGVYHVSEPIKVTKANTVLLGLGEATIIPDNEEAAIVTEDVGGIAICGLILDAGNYSKTLLTVGNEGSNKDHSHNPAVLSDVIYRVGGTGHLGRCDSCQVINSNNVIVDHTWIWRADHGDNTGWSKNVAKNGLIVNGDNVTCYGLFVEHFTEYDIIWRGEKGSTYFLQNEKCYDPQSQKEWMSHSGGKKGYAAYKVANNVKEHYAVGLGVYDVFINTNGKSIYLDNAIEVPDTENVLIENACIVEIAAADGPKVGINHIVNDTTAGIRTGAGNNGGYAIQRLLNYTNGNSVSLSDYYKNSSSTEQKQEVGETPTNDSYAEKDIKKDEISMDNEKPLWEMTEEDFDEKIENGIKEENNSEKPGGNTGDSGNTGNNQGDSGNSGNNDNRGDTENNGNNKPGENADKPEKNTGIKAGKKITVGKFTYKITKVSKSKKGTVSLCGISKKQYAKKMKTATIKSRVKYMGYTFKVTDIGTKAFKNAIKLKKIVIGSNVKKISYKAFYNCKKIKKIVVKGKTLKKVSDKAFNKKVKKTAKIKANKKIKRRILRAFRRK